MGLLAAPRHQFHENLLNGYFDGTLTGSFNFAMEPMIDHINAWKRRDLNEACRIWESGLADLQHYFYFTFSRFHLRYKEATWLRGLIPLPFMRPPLTRPSTQEILELRALLVKAGMEVIPESDMNRLMPQFMP